MRRTRRHTRTRIVVAASGMALAVAVMHVLVLCGTGSHSGVGSTDPVAPMSAAHSAAGHPIPVMVPGAPNIDRIGASITDCGMHEHGCVFLRGEVIGLVVALGVVIALSPVRRLIGVWRRRSVVVLGRPPPWAIRDHLFLSVIVR